MKYLEALQKILNGIENDNAHEIEAGAEILIASVGDVPLSDCERVIALHLTKRAADLCHVCGTPYYPQLNYCHVCGTNR